MDIDFIYTNQKWEEQGYLTNCKIDIEIGKYKVASNDFEITVNDMNWDRVFDENSLFYSECSEFGGIIENKRVNTATKEITLKGTTFRGLLEKEYVQPPDQQAYLHLRGEANQCISDLLANKFGSLFIVDDIGKSNINIDYQIRDMNLLDALERMLAKKNARIEIKYMDEQCHIKAVPISDLSEKLQIDSSYRLNMIVEESKDRYNHILALGKGELTARLRVNLYRQDDDTWKEKMNTKYTGLKRKTFKYEDTNQEDMEELKSQAIEKANEANGSDTISVDFQNDEAELFDIVAAKEEITDISFKDKITKKILRAEFNGRNKLIKLEHKVGDN